MSLLAKQQKTITFYVYLLLKAKRKSEGSKLQTGEGEDEKGVKEKRRMQSCRQDYWTSMDVGSGNRWERKCAGSRSCDRGGWKHRS